MPFRPPGFDSTAEQLAPYLANLPGKLIAIDGRDGSGKTTLGRFLAWYFNVALVETDLFLQQGAGLTYHTDQIERLVVFSDYEATFSPQSVAQVSVQLAH